MERESFQDAAVAAIMNRHFINIKVDREERPDLDDIYMNAVVSMTGKGGWPMSVFLTPDLQPFYGGTYFPPHDHFGMPGFPRVLEAVARAWREDRQQIHESARKLTLQLKARLTQSVPEGEEGLTPDVFEAAAAALDASYDAEWGGWGGAPKFPSGASISLLLRHYQRKRVPWSLEMATVTLDHMAHGGIRDHLGGGFHRYAVDEMWLVPHFEKMLYDNAQLATVYLEAWQLTGKSAYCDVARETLDYLLRDMRHETGGFFASEDADSGGEEGVYYLWRRQQVLDCLGKGAGTFFCDYYNIREEGNFTSHEACHKAMNIVHTANSPAVSAQTGTTPLTTMRQMLLDVRSKRARPFLDDKIVTSWNALAITAFARAAQILDDKGCRDAALAAGTFLLAHVWKDDMLMRYWRNGAAIQPGYLDDYSCSVNALIDLYETSFDYCWLAAARKLADHMIMRFHDDECGGFFAAGDEHSHLLFRLKSLHDTAEPSGNAMAARALLRLAVFFDDAVYAEKARNALRLAAPLMRRAPQGCLHSLLAADMLFHLPVEIVIAGGLNHPDMSAMLNTVHGHYLPNRIIAHAGDAEKNAGLPIIENRDASSDAVKVFLCHDHRCLAPVSTPEALVKQIKTLAGNSSMRAPFQ